MDSKLSSLCFIVKCPKSLSLFQLVVIDLLSEKSSLGSVSLLLHLVNAGESAEPQQSKNCYLKHFMGPLLSCLTVAGIFFFCIFIFLCSLSVVLSPAVSQLIWYGSQQRILKEVWEPSAKVRPVNVVESFIFVSYFVFSWILAWWMYLNSHFQTFISY